MKMSEGFRDKLVVVLQIVEIALYAQIIVLSARLIVKTLEELGLKKGG